RIGTDWNQAEWPISLEGDADITQWHYQETTGLLTGKEDAMGRFVSYTYLDGQKLGTRTWARLDNANPLETTYSYDPATGELTGIDYADATPDITFTYDRLGRQVTVTDGAGSRTFAYNPATLQLQTESINGIYSQVITRNYETGQVPGRPTGYSLDSGQSITYGYDSTGRMETVAWDIGTTGTATYSYEPDSDLLANLTVSTGTGADLISSYAYDPERNLRTQLKHEYGVNLISQYDYGYDTIGRRDAAQNSGDAFSAVTNAFNIYDYNDRNELTTSNRYLGSDIGDTNNPVQDEFRSYEYDPIGNRVEAVEDDNTFTYAANSLNQYSGMTATEAGTAIDSLTYDEDGNLTATVKTDGTVTYTYNAENRLTVVEPATPGDGDSKVEFIYDYMGRRAKKAVSIYSGGSWSVDEERLFVYDGWNLISEHIDDGGAQTTKYYVWGLDLSQSLQGAGGIGGLVASIEPSTSETYYFTYDGNGNVGQLVSAADGAIAAHYNYDPFGNTISAYGPQADDNSFRFSTKYFGGESGLYYYGYRYYSPGLGRWLNRDPIGESGSLNIYMFLKNDSLNLLDRLGLDPIVLFDMDLLNSDEESPHTRRTWRDQNFWRGWNLALFDERGKELLGRWLNGSGDPLFTHGGRWGRYMMDNNLMPEQLFVKLERDAKFRDSSGFVNIDPFSVIIENGYTTGYEMLHETKATVGNFTIEGFANHSIDSSGAKVIDYEVTYTWHDIIDPDNNLITDFIFANILRIFYNPKDYDAHISWDANSSITLCGPTILKSDGYPFDQIE
ncbi:MAG: RHS repeat-associated core domain-containing protein, partial [candidate division Zixibacteria bacterium]|nr:RHS repeat-associated core domain-containing protein [candidate division Zixibacteria bacterium]